MFQLSTTTNRSVSFTCTFKSVRLITVFAIYELSKKKFKYKVDVN